MSVGSTPDDIKQIGLGALANDSYPAATTLHRYATPIFNSNYVSGTVTNVAGDMHVHYEHSLQHGIIPALTAQSSDCNKSEGLTRDPTSAIHIHHAVRAQFNCGDRVTCTEGTRAELISKLNRWIASGPPVFWLNGLAGTGKTTIISTIAQQCQERNILAASFFCSRDDAECSNHKLIFPTIAFQLAHFCPRYGKQLAIAIQKNPDIVDYDVGTQLLELLLLPLRKTNRLRSPCVIIIDALDECKDGHTESTILAAISQRIGEVPKQIKFLITSRPISSIVNGFRSASLLAMTQKFSLHEIQLTVVEADIMTYLVRELKRIRRFYDISLKWPSNGDIQSLSRLSSGLFIFAATSIRVIQEPAYGDPIKQMENLLHNTALLESELSPHRRLDQLYLQVLADAYPTISVALAERLRTVLGTIVLAQNPLSLTCLQQLLGQALNETLDIRSIRQTLSQVHSVILVPAEDTGIIKFLHPSFFDFITNRDRCTDLRFLLDKDAHHMFIACACLQTMNSLRRNICGLPTHPPLNDEIIDLSQRIESTISPHLQYACLHWATHVKLATFSGQLPDLLTQFCSKHLLHWVEVVSLLHDLKNQLILLDEVRRMLKSVNPKSDAAALLDDCERLIREFFPGISKSWMQVYDTAVIFTVRESAMRRLYLTQSSTARELHSSAPESNHKLCLRVMEGHRGSVRSVAISTDSTLIASGSKDTTIIVWDFIGGEPLRALKGHSKSVESVAFSPDGTQIVSGSKDRSLILWSTKRGSHVSTLKNHSRRIISTTFSPDGSLIASGSRDLTISIWDVMIGALVTLRGHSSAIAARISVSFLPDGNLIGYALKRGGELQVWNLVTAKKQKTLRGCSSPFALSLDGSRLLAGIDLEDTLQLFRTNSSEKQRVHFKGHSGGVESIAFSASGRRIVSGSSDCTLRLWDAATETYSKPSASTRFFRSWRLFGNKPRQIKGRLTSLQLSKDGTRLMAVFQEGDDNGFGVLCSTAHLWNTVTGAYVKAIGGNLGQCFVFSPDDRWIVSESFFHGLGFDLWDAKNAPPLRFGCGVLPAITRKALKGHSEPISMIVFSPDGSRIVSASNDRTLRLWDAVTGAHMKTMEGHLGPVTSVVYSSDGAQIASGSYDCTVRLWDASSGTLLKTLDALLKVPYLRVTSDRSSIITNGVPFPFRLLDGRNASCVLPADLWTVDDEKRLSSDSALENRPSKLLILLNLFVILMPFHVHLVEGIAGPRIFQKDGWICISRPREQDKQLRWIPRAWRRFLASAGTLVALGTEDGRIVAIDLAESSTEDGKFTQ
ncbi:hypothetical protein HWV62_6745 [Athelia sp. TMB]|nr:hypothetical protein HWV62_6745 [Athelia sp. TMB]